MQKVKGICVTSIPLFIKEKFGDESLNKWKEALKPESKDIYEGATLTSSWYPIQVALVEPTKVMAELFYGGDLKKAAWEAGRFSADHALKGAYKLFVKLGKPSFIIKRASGFFLNIYDPSKLVVDNWSDKHVDMIITEFEDFDQVAEWRMMSWMERCMEINGCTNVKIQVKKSMNKGDDCTEIYISWD